MTHNIPDAARESAEVVTDRNDARSPENPTQFKPFHPSPGRHRNIVKAAPATPEEVRALLFEVLDKATANKMIYALRRKIAKGNVSTLEFLFDRLIGRPAVQVSIDANIALTRFMDAWQGLALVQTFDEQDAPLLPSTGATIDADYRSMGDETEENDAE